MGIVISSSVLRKTVISIGILALLVVVVLFWIVKKERQIEVIYICVNRVCDDIKCREFGNNTLLRIVTKTENDTQTMLIENVNSACEIMRNE